MLRLRTLALLLAIAGIFTLHPAFASGDVKGRFDGRVMCQAGMKKAEFKSADTQALSYSSAGDIKRRINILTWPDSGATASFTDREKEKTELQHALKLLRDYSCDDADAPAPAPDPNERGSGPALLPHPD